MPDSHNQERKSYSREHSREFLKRERQQIGALADDIGADVVGRLDRLLTRELIYERKERELAKIFELEHEAPHYTVLLNAKSGRVMPSALTRPAAQRERRTRLRQMQRGARLSIARLEADAKENGAQVVNRLWLTHTVVARVDPDQLERLAAREDLATVVADKWNIVYCLDVSRPLIQADQVVNRFGFNGTGVTVAVVDSGVDATHPALAAVVTSQQDFTGAGIGDGLGHGTHCAGIIASQDRTFTGIAPGASLGDFRMMDAGGNSTPQIAISAVQAAVAAGVNVASNSWGWSHANGAWTDANGTCVLCTAADAAMAAGVVFVVAAGNEDNDTCATYDTHIRCPGMARSVITVGASTDSDNMAGFSSIGPTPDGRTKPDLVAPGQEIASCRATGTSLGSTVDPAGLFINLDGTSMACPHVAGVAALMLDRTPALTPAQVLGILTTTCVNIGAAPNEMGAGRVDALAAVNAS